MTSAGLDVVAESRGGEGPRRWYTNVTRLNFRFAPRLQGPLMIRPIACLLLLALVVASRAEPPPIDFAAARKHWAYQPVRKPVLPTVKQADWPASPVDSFILVRLEA